MSRVGGGRELDGSAHWFGKQDVLVFGEEFEAEEIDEEACCKSILASSPTLEPGDLWRHSHILKKRKVRRVMGWLLSLQLRSPVWGWVCAFSIVYAVEP